MTVSKEAKVGILAIVSFAMLYLGFNFLKGKDFFSSSNDYYVFFDDVDGLQVSNPVVLNGLTIGKVKQIELLQEQNNRLKVTLTLNKTIKLGKNTDAVLLDGGLLGGKTISLKFKNGGGFLEDGDTLVAKKVTGLTALLTEKALPILTHADSLILNLEKVVKQFDKTGVVLKSVLTNANFTVSSLNSTILENKANLAGVMGNFKQLSANLVETEKSLKPLLSKFGGVADSLNALKLSQVVAQANQSMITINAILSDLQKGQGTAGKLIKDETLYKNINVSMMNLDKLLLDLRLHPKRYFSILRRKETPYAEATPEEIEATKVPKKE